MENKSSQWVAANTPAPLTASLQAVTVPSEIQWSLTRLICATANLPDQITLVLFRSNVPHRTFDPTETRGTKPIRSPKRTRGRSRLKQWSRNRINPITQRTSQGTAQIPRTCMGRDRGADSLNY